MERDLINRMILEEVGKRIAVIMDRTEQYLDMAMGSTDPKVVREALCVVKGLNEAAVLLSGAKLSPASLDSLEGSKSDIKVQEASN